jgi:hypothetical protein
MKLSPLRQYLLAAMLWLPLMFALWFALGSVVAYPIVRASHHLVDWILPGLLHEAGQNYASLLYSYVVEISGVQGLPQAAKLLIEEQSVNVLIYAWGMPLFCGLAAASPLDWKHTFLQWAIGLVVLTMACTFGVTCEVLYAIRDGTANAVSVALNDQGYAAVAQQAGEAAGRFIAARYDAVGISADLIALLRQFGYLILPSVVPISLWILLNRRFLESLVEWNDDPASHPDNTPVDQP